MPAPPADIAGAAFSIRSGMTGTLDGVRILVVDDDPGVRESLRRSLIFNGYEVVVPRDCCAATGAREQESTLYDIATHIGVVTEAECVVAALTTGAIIANIDLAA